MTSRPALGVQQRQPQRSLSGSSLSQRPAHQRSLSQTYLPPSPIRKETSFGSDFSSPDSSDAGQGRYGTQRRGGSRLKLELSHDPDSITDAGIIESPNALESSKPFTPSRIMPLTDSSDLGDMSPRPSTRGLTVDFDTPLPMPPRRQRFTLASCCRGSQSQTPAPPKKDSRPKPYTVEIPSAAPRFSTNGKTESHGKTGTLGAAGAQNGTGFADFVPWTGENAEDQFTENVIRQGFFDKAPIGQTETSSAKGALFAALKHKSGLHALSTVFTGVLGQRRHSGQITAPSTFKPPPRVTVTDTKREMWLKDLANPAIPLRRLSRTIPHGIRGKVLLDQCLNKNVPTERAVWLAKCVGANEIRAFKRKGVNGNFVHGGEAKWIKDWTAVVEQFVESIVSAFGDAEWKGKVTYAIRFATHLYYEHLLDREHYQEWLVASIENAQQAKLPMWMIITQIYWNDLRRLRKYGRRLVTALLSHLHIVQTHPDKDILRPLSNALASLINNLILDSPENFVSHGPWFKYRETLHSILPADDLVRQEVFKKIGSRNEQLAASGNRTQPAARHILVKMLDTTLQAPITNDLPTQCWNVSKDKAALVRVLLEWCTSLYRPGLAKVYVTSRIIKHWNTLGVDVTAALMDFLDVDPMEEPGRKKALYHLVCELIRSGHFSVARYMQWLIARGGIKDPHDLSPDGPAGTRLLAELPTYSLTESQRSIRAGMLRRAHFSVEDEARDIELAIKCVSYALGLSTEVDDPMMPRKKLSINKLSKRIGLSGHTLRTAVGSWLRMSVTSYPEAPIKEESEDVAFAPVTFLAIRTLLEAAEDFSMLADVVKSMTRSSIVEVLASCADTLQRHLFIFAAIGASRDLFDALHARLKAIAEQQQLRARQLLASLVTLSQRIPGLEELAVQLKNDLALTDRHNPVNACSPVSDSMAAHLQDDDAMLHEEIEKLLTSGTSLDRNTMDRLFQTVVQRLQSCWGKSSDKQQRAYSALLTRLRMFDTQHFDALMSKFLLYLRTMGNRPSILQIYPLLICVGCLSMPMVLATTSVEPISAQGAGFARPPAPGAAAAVQLTYRTRYMQEVLQLFTSAISPDGLVTPEESYHFSILQEQALKENAKELLVLVRNAFAEFSYARSQNDTNGLPLDNADMKAGLVDMLRLLVLKDASGVARALSVKSSDTHVDAWIQCMTTKLLIPAANEGTHVTFDQVLDLTNEFTLPFCQVKLSLSLAAGDMNSPEATDRQHSHLELFAKAMDNAIGAKNMAWTGMLSCLSPEITHHLKSRAQAHFLELIPSLRSPTPAGRTLQESLQMGENLLSVIDAIIRGGSMGRPPQLVPAMVDKLADLWEILASGEAEAKAPILSHWLPFLLNFITLHTQTFDTSRASNEVRAKAVVVCVGVLQELDFIYGNQMDGLDVGELALRIFDLACLLVDNLADDFRLICVNAVKAVSSDARLRYILSFSANPSEHLMLSHKEKPPPGSGRTAGPLPGGGLLGTPVTVWGLDRQSPERLSVFQFRRWEILSEPTPVIGENDTALSLGLFDARKMP